MAAEGRDGFADDDAPAQLGAGRADGRGEFDELRLLHDVAIASAALDVRRLFENSLRRVAATLAADAAFGWVLDDAGELVLRGHVGGTPVMLGNVARMSRDDGIAGEAVARLETVRLADARARRPDYFAKMPAELVPAEALAVPLLLGDSRALGVIGLARREPRPFGPREIALAEAVAAEIAVAVENARLFDVTRRRAEDLSMLYELSRSVATTLDLATLLHDGATTLAATVQAPDAYLMLPDESGAALESRVIIGTHAHVGPLRMPLRDPARAGIAAAAYLTREPQSVEDGVGDPRVDQHTRERCEGRAYLAVPLVAHDRAIGAAVIIDPRGPRRFTRAELERALAVANQLAIALENAQLYEDLRRSYADLAQAQQQLVQRERLAALGELAAIVAHEVRNPLAVLFNSLGSLRRLLRPSGDVELLVDIMDEESARLNRIVGDLLDFARPIAPARTPEPIERVLDEAVDEALASGEPGAVLVERHVEPGLPLVAMDARMVRQAVINLVQNAAQAMPGGGAIRVRASADRAQPGARPRGVVVAIEDTGVGITPVLRERIFEPFFTTKARGSGLGLVVVRRIVEAHGGRVALESEPGRGTVFTIVLPVGDDDAPGSRSATTPAPSMRR